MTSIVNNMDNINGYQKSNLVYNINNKYWLYKSTLRECILKSELFHSETKLFTNRKKRHIEDIFGYQAVL